MSVSVEKRYVAAPARTSRREAMLRSTPRRPPSGRRRRPGSAAGSADLLDDLPHPSLEDRAGEALSVTSDVLRVEPREVLSQGTRERGRVVGGNEQARGVW